MVFTNSLSSYYEKFLATGEVKCIDEEIPFEIPKGWEWSKLSNVIELLSGQDFIPEKYNSSNQGIPYITGASNIVNGNLVINRWTETPTVIGKLGDKVCISGRSIGDINVQIILEKLGGGGHITLAGAQVEGMSIEEVKNLLIEKINEYFSETAN